jgi:hypothetical protein
MFGKDDERKLISIEKIKKTISSKDLTDEEAMEIQASLDILCEILYEQLKQD